MTQFFVDQLVVDESYPYVECRNQVLKVGWLQVYDDLEEFEAALIKTAAEVSFDIDEEVEPTTFAEAEAVLRRAKTSCPEAAVSWGPFA